MRVLITGGTGTVGCAFLHRYAQGNECAVISRNEKMQYDLKKIFPNVETYLSSVENKEAIYSIYDKFRPDTVVHAAAIKHVDVAEKQPIQTTLVNIVGSLNIINASVEFNVPITIAVSTDKACEHQHIYGITKYIMEQCFLEANGDKNRFAVCRFGNVAHSNGSVIPFWLKQKEQGNPVKLTSPDMNRLMFLPSDAAGLIGKTIEMCRDRGGFILSKKMKNVNMFRLAKMISGDVEITGARPGEKFDEDLISIKELPYTKVVDNDYVVIERSVNGDIQSRLTEAYNTKTAANMDDKELWLLINNKESHYV